MGMPPASRIPSRTREATALSADAEALVRQAQSLITEASGAPVPAARALLDEAARRHARALASGPGLALAMAKRQFAAAAGQTLEQALTLEAAMVPLMTQTRDFAEGVSAFTERRSAQFEAA